jgi:hypothetical protein
MRRTGVALVAAAFVAASGGPAMSKSSVPRGFAVSAAAQLYSGVGYAKLVKENGPVTAHVAFVAPGASVDLRVVNAYDKIPGSTRELETTSSMCARLRCIVGLNGDFHKAGSPAGAVIVDGRMLHSPDPHRPQLTITGDGRLVAGPVSWTGSLTPAGGAELAVTGVNSEPVGHGLTLYTSDFGPRTERQAGVELVVRATGALGLLNQPTEVELRGIRPGPGPIPPGGAVLSGDGVAAQQLRDLWTGVQKGSRRAQLAVHSPVDARLSLGADPVVLRDSRRALPWRDPNLAYPRQPHTLVGWNKAGETYLVAVDGRQPASAGMTMAEAADFLLALGATDAVNLDGGGGTTFVAGGSVWNRPSDNDPARPTEYEERGTANALVVMARPGAPPPPATPPAPKPAPRRAAPPAGADAVPEDLFTPNGVPTVDGMPLDSMAAPVPDAAEGAPPGDPAEIASSVSRSAVRLADGTLGEVHAGGVPTPANLPPGSAPAAAGTDLSVPANPEPGTAGEAPAATADDAAPVTQGARHRTMPLLQLGAFAAAAARAVLLLRRRRRARHIGLPSGGFEPASAIDNLSGEDDEVVAVDDLVRRPLGQVTRA